MSIVKFTTMKLFEIIDIFIQGDKSIEHGTIKPYINSLNTYFGDYFCQNVMALCVSYSNNSSYFILSPEQEIFEALQGYGLNVNGYYEAVETNNWDMDTDGIETILFHSRPLIDLI